MDSFPLEKKNPLEITWTTVNGHQKITLLPVWFCFLALNYAGFLQAWSPKFLIALDFEWLLCCYLPCFHFSFHLISLIPEKRYHNQLPLFSSKFHGHVHIVRRDQVQLAAVFTFEMLCLNVNLHCIIHRSYYSCIYFLVCCRSY